MRKLAADEDFNHRIVSGLLNREPTLDVVRVQEAGLSGMPDPGVLEWAAQEGRLLLTHDTSTMTHHAYERVRQGLPMPGVFAVNQDLPNVQTIEDILFVAIGSFEGEWEGQVRYLPLR